MRVGIVGCGVIGRRRALVVHESENDDVAVVADVDGDRAKSTAEAVECAWTIRWEEVVDRDDVDVVVIATTNDWLSPISRAALESGKHVLCEKPVGRNPDELHDLVEAADCRGLILKAGFNLRHASAIARAQSACKEGAIGELTFLRARYGHGGRPRMESEWRSNASVAGGGELLDQGIHLVDLFRWFAGEFGEVFGYKANYCWPAPLGVAEVEDNAFALFRSARGYIASLHVSWTQWKNLFSFEVFGTEGYLVVEGLGGSYGPCTLRRGKRSMTGGVPEETCEEFDGSDNSWEREWRELVSAIIEKRQPLGSGRDALRALEMVHGAYESALTGGVIRLPEV